MSHWDNKREGIEQTLVLLQKPNGVHVQEIMETLNCHRATVYRYFQEIALKYPIDKLDNGNYWINPRHHISNVSLHPAEALTIYLALRRFIAKTNRAPKFMLSAIQKVIPALRREDLIDNLIVASENLRHLKLASDDEIAIWETLIDGWLNNRVLRITYLKPNAQSADVHECEPYLFEPMPHGDGTYAIVWSRTRNSLRTFKIERIQHITKTSEHFTPRQLTIDSLIEHAWGIWYGEQTERVILRFAPEKARRVMESSYHLSETKQLLPDGSLEWSVEVAALREITHWILGWGAGVEVIAPDALRQEVADELRRAAAVYE